MPKKICLFSDGTGNSSAKVQRRTNVWRMFQALDQTQPDQIANLLLARWPFAVPGTELLQWGERRPSLWR